MFVITYAIIHIILHHHTQHSPRACWFTIQLAVNIVTTVNSLSGHYHCFCLLIVVIKYCHVNTQ